MNVKTLSANGRALVLGGGGALGNAWLIGVIAGLLDGGVDVTRPDLIIGTSAGSTVAAQISNTTRPGDLFTSILAEVHQPSPVPAGADTRSVPARLMGNHMETTSAIIAAAINVADMRIKMGAWALTTDATASGQEQWRKTVAGRLPGHKWPERQMFITAVDAHTGEPVVFSNNSGVDLVDAVAASCAGGFAYNIGNRYYIDGGYRTNADNADLATGYARVLVLSPFGGRSRTPFNWGTHLATQVDELRAQGSAVETIFPDTAALEAFGDNMMNISRRPLAARAGHDHGRSLAGQLTEFWR